MVREFLSNARLDAAIRRGNALCLQLEVAAADNPLLAQDLGVGAGKLQRRLTDLLREVKKLKQSKKRLGPSGL